MLDDMQRYNPQGKRLMLRYCRVLPVGTPEGRATLSGIFQLVVQHHSDMEGVPMQLYVTVTESTVFNFTTTYLTTTEFYDRDDARTPVVLEWAIAQNTTCEGAKINKTSYACVSNDSYCSTNDAGYVCKCSDGYEGNPYIVGGCTGSSSSSLF